MDASTASVIWSALMLALFVGAMWRLHRRKGRIGPGAIGTVDQMLNDERRKAVQIIVEQRAEQRRPEYPDGNLPDLEDPKRPPR